MNYLNYLKQFWNRKDDYFVPIFWSKVFRIIKYNILTKRVSQEEFKKNLDRIRIRPFNIHFEFTNVCNAKCIFCAYQYMKRKKGFMPMEIFLKALKDYEEMGGGDVHFSGVVGDSLLDPNLIERIRIARSVKVVENISIITNGINLNCVDVKSLLISGLNKVYVSLAEFDEKIYEGVYRVKKYKDMFRGLLNLFKLNKELGNVVDITIGFRSPRPLNKIIKTEDFKKISQYKPNFDFVWVYDSWGARIKNENLEGVMKLRTPSSKKEPCVWFFDGPIIFENGDVGFCGCRDFEANSELIVGNIMERHLIDIWRDEKVEKIRKGFYARNIPDICRDCGAYRNLSIFRTTEGTKRAIETEKRFLSSKIYNQR